MKTKYKDSKFAKEEKLRKKVSEWIAYRRAKMEAEPKVFTLEGQVTSTTRSANQFSGKPKCVIGARVALPAIFEGRTVYCQDAVGVELPAPDEMFDAICDSSRIELTVKIFPKEGK